jgi:type VI secretion system secreted protein VgrG
MTTPPAVTFGEFVPLTQAESYVSIVTPAGDDVLVLTSVRGEERLSAPFHFFLEMTSSKADIDFSTIVGKSATVTIKGGSDTKRIIDGIMTRFVHAGTVNSRTTYLGELRPWFWLLTLSSDYRVFQTKSVIEIATEIFGQDYPDFRDATTGTLPKREYCVQYGETTFAFISRLLEEEGIHYFFEHADGKHTLVFANSPDAHKKCPAPSAVRYGAPGADREEDDLITSCLFERQVASNGYVLEDYEFTTPALELATTVDGSVSGNLKLYEYPGGYATKDRGDAVARLRIEAQEVDTTVLRGSSLVRTLTPGFTFDLTDHTRSDVNATYLVRSVSHAASHAEYSNDFDAIPAAVPFRPAPTVAKPRIHGAQTAIVVGKKDEEIWTDAYGRVTVQFHWDRTGKKDENSSCWVRVAQAWAGKGWGALFIPRVGQEVIVTFLDGDPDRPIITGAVYNGTNAPPYTGAADQTKSTIKTSASKRPDGESEPRFNEIRFDDAWKAEELYLRAQNNMTVDVQFDRTATVKNNDTLTVTKARAVTVSEGDDTHTVSKGARTVSITEGDDTLTVAKGKRTVTVAGDYVLKISGGLTIEAKSVAIKASTTLASEAGTSLSSKAGSDLTIEATGSLTSKGATATVDGGSMLVIKGGMVKIN